MLNAKGSILADNQSLTQWAVTALGLSEVQVQVRLRGNHLHILCESADSPPRNIAVAKYSAALSVTDLEKLLPRQKGYNHPRIYQVFLCGRRLGTRQNDWAERLEYPGQNRHPEPLKRSDEPPVVTTISELADALPLTNLGKKQQESQISATYPTTDDIAIPSSGGIRNKKIAKNVSHTPEAEAFVTSPLTIDTASTARLSSADSVTFDSFSYPMTVGQTTHQNTATLEAPRQEIISTSDESGLTISCERLARRGYPDAIASYLSEILGALGVAVKVTIREQGNRKSGDFLRGVTSENQAMGRLWVLCESVYSPDPSLLAEPIARRLRDLKLENFGDAVICSQVRGEKSPEWMLRVDLTPQSHILKEWARWGDGGAIARLLNQELANAGIEVRATLKEFTLHLFCHLKSPVRSHSAPDKHLVLEIIAPILTTIAPCGIRAATVYGLESPKRTDDEVPVWVDWLNLPAAHHPDLAVSAKSLAMEGDRSALLFLIDRLLNPNLDLKLQTGGIRALILIKGDLLHIMTEAPTCPSQSQVAPLIGEFLRKLAIPGIVGVRIYGRRAGQKLPLWRYGVEVTKSEVAGKLAINQEKSLVLSRKASFLEDVSPEFAASAMDMSFTGFDGDLVLVEDFPEFKEFSGEVLTAKPEMRRSRPQLGTVLLGLQRSLIASGFFVPNDALVTTVGNADREWRVGVASRRHRQAVLAIVWASFGCLLAFQVDAMMGNFLEYEATTNTVTQLGAATKVDGKQESVNFPSPSVSPSPSIAAVESRNGEGKRGKDGDRTHVSKSENLNSQKSLVKTSETHKVSIPFSPLQSSLSSDRTEPKDNPEKGNNTNNTDVFNRSGFIKPLSNQVAIAAKTKKQNRVSKFDIVTNYPTFKSDQLDEQLIRYQKYLQTHQRLPDIMIVGSSRALRGIEPTVLEKALAERGYPGLHIYNFGVNGATVQVVDLIVRRVLPVEQLPKLIVFADGARAVNSGRVDVTYNAIANSEGYKQLTQGTLHIRTHQGAATKTKSASSTPLASVTELMQYINSNGVAMEEFLHKKLSDVSGTYRHRDRLKTWLHSSIISGSKARSPNQKQQTVEAKPIDSKQKSEFNSNGFLPIDLRFDPPTYYQKYSQVSGDYDADYKSFKLEGKQTDALKNLWEYTKANNINLVFVNMPLTKDYLDPIRTTYEQEFQQKMQQLADETGWIFRDIVLLWPEARENFSDPSHLNQYGAVEVSKYLAQDPMIPWPKSQDRDED